MSTYQFNVTDGQTVVVDHEGAEIGQNRNVMTEALHTAWELLAEGVRTGADRSHWRLDVVGPAGEPVMSLPFKLAIKPEALRRTAA